MPEVAVITGASALIAVVLEAVNLLLRLRNPDTIGSIGIYLSGLVVLILIYSGWKGGELVFRYGVGVLDDRPTR